MLRCKLIAIRSWGFEGDIHLNERDTFFHCTIEQRVGRWMIVLSRGLIDNVVRYPSETDVGQL